MDSKDQALFAKIELERQQIIALLRKGTLKKFMFKRNKQDFKQWDFSICGPPGSPWAGLCLTGSLTFPSNFPDGDLNFNFKPAIWHPNVRPSNGFVCLGNQKSTAKDRIESGKFSVSEVFMLLHQFLLFPNPDNSWNGEAARLYKENRAEYIRQATADAKKKFAEY